jgi:hypothetical protein
VRDRKTRLWTRPPGIVVTGRVYGVILGIDLPGPHAVLSAPEGWWSWGELTEPWTATVEEAWAVSWS